MARRERLAILLHRYVGLSLVVFLVIAGLTGSLIAFNEELDAQISPELFHVEQGEPPLDPFEVQRRVQENLPAGTRFRTVNFFVEDGRSLVSWAEGPDGIWRQWFVDPHDGSILGGRTWGDLAEGKQNVMPFLYRLHYSLGLDMVGTVLFGVAAVLWTIDCFVGLYLTLPVRGPERAPTRGRTWLARWGRAWRVRANNTFALVFTGHRAGGLWLWAILLVFAWSAVGLNLPPVQRAVMDVVVETQTVGHETLPHLTPPYPEPTLSLHDAHARGREEMARQAEARGFTVFEERSLYYADDHGVYGYVVRSSLDISGKRPWTEVYIDGQTGAYLGFNAPTGVATGNTIASWLVALHMATVFGAPYRLFVCVLGLLVAALSITGALIWWRKRPKRRRATSP